jgi:EAL and modified HD-GYP domain-containing signal transduction protein
MSPDFPTPRFLARQSVLDGDYRIAGFDLRLTSGSVVPLLPGAGSAEQARDESLLAHVADMNKQGMLSGRFVVLGLSEGAMENPMLSQMPPGKIMVPFPPASTDGGARTAELNAGGLVPLLDDDLDAVPSLPTGCRAVRIDFASSEIKFLAARADRFRKLGARRLVAGNVDSHEAFDTARKMGFDLFQGGFLFHPGHAQKEALNASVMRVMDLLNKTISHAPVEELEAGFKLDAGLSYRLLRYINSPASGLGQPMQSVRQALIWLGHEPLYRWLSLLLFSGASANGRGEALLRNALVRARFMENLGAARLESSLRGGLFIVGILSLLDALLGRPMAEALAPLRLPDHMSGALLEGVGPYAPYLALCRASEQFDQKTIASIAAGNGFSADDVNLAHVDALIWSEALEK